MDMLENLIKRLSVANVSAVAKEANVSRKTLARICDRANSPTVATVQKISRALDELKVPKRPAINTRGRAPEEKAEA